jgi:VCBS repeat-containing protein
LERRELLAAGPRLISVNPNADEIFSPSQSNLLSVRPTELTFRFGGASDLDPATLGAIQITRAGGDGQFGDANDVTITPGYIGFNETDRIVVTRFAEALPDDFYRIDVFATDDAAAGVVGLRDVDGNLLQPTDPASNKETVFFDLELGARVSAVVPQPVVGTGAARTQLKQQIHIYFDDPDLFNGPAGPDSTLTEPRFYKLIRTADTANPADDTTILPTTVTVNAGLQRVELDFGTELHLLPGTGVFRLRIGTDEQVAPPLQVVTPGADAGSITAAATDLGVFADRTARLVTGQSIVSAGLPLDYPGANNEPGSRQIQHEDHLSVPPDTEATIAQRTYTIRNGLPYGLNSANQPVFSSINPEQQRRVREIFDFYGELLGIDFIEVDTLDISAVDHAVVVGDLNPNGGVSGPGGVIGLAANPGLLAIMDGAENWDNSYGGEFFETAMHEIGHLLGHGHSYDLPGGTIMGSTPRLPSAGEFVYPGDADIVHGQLMYRPDNRDVDMFRFEVAPGQAGKVTIETIAERLGSSSNLDTHLTLFRQNAVGAIEKIAANDDMFGNDSYLSLDLEEGTYFVGVVAQGNDVFDPTKDGTGSGGSSEGDYQLRIEFRSGAASSVLDTKLTPVDGDGDGESGGTFNFWFRANDPATTIYVDPSANVVTANGTLATPFRTLKSALGAATPGSIIRMLPSSGLDLDLTTTGDNRAYEIGEIPSLNTELLDGANFVVPAGVTVMIEPGAVLKMLNSRIMVGSGSGGIDASLGAIQVLGTPDTPVTFTSYSDASIAINTNALDNTPSPGDWGGIQIRNDFDRSQGRAELERQGIFMNYIAGAEMRYGGGQVRINNQFQSVAPIDLYAARPTLLGNVITDSNAAAIAADPASFEETTFNEPRYQRFGQFVADYSRSGPLIYANTFTDNSLNGLFVRVDTDGTGNLRQLEVPARFSNTEVVHVLGENLFVRGNPGGSIVDATLPGLDLVTVTPTTGGAGTLAAGSYQYRLSFVDANGYETQASAATTAAVLTATGSIALSGLPAASGDFVARRLYRSVNGGAFEFLAPLSRNVASYTDSGIATNPGVTAITTPVVRPRPDARLAIDPGIIVKSSGVRIQTGFGADLIAEGTEGRPVVFTARSDDRYGAGGTFNTNNTVDPSSGSMGSWAGIYASPFSVVSIDQAVVAYAGGNAGAAGGTVGFNALELRQARARVAHTTFEFNASGVLAGQGTRSGLGPNEATVIYVAGAQPVIVENIFRDNSVSGTSMISFDANALTATPLEDFGRQTGTLQTIVHPPGNLGPLVRGNAITRAGIGGLRVRAGTLTTETVWDDTDIVHVVQGTILVPDFHTFGGLRLQSRFNESLVAKFGAGATLIADGRPLDIEDRIGGRIQILGSPGFPVIMTSLQDDSVGAGYGPLGLPFSDTNGDGTATTGAPGQWRGIQLKEFSHDRNIATVTEREGRVAGGGDANGAPNVAQFVGQLATEDRSGDENLRLGFAVYGTIADPGDSDVYSFSGTAGTLVWIDLDRTGAALDTVLEFVDADGNVLARSDNSQIENQTGMLPFFDAGTFAPGQAMPMPKGAFAERNAINGTYRDLYSINPLDAAMRVVLPGTVGEQDEYFVRVRGADGTTGDYQLHVRLREDDETAGSAIQFANISYAQIGIDTSGMPGHSLLAGEAGVTPGQTNVRVLLGNVLTSDRAAVSAAGQLSSAGDTNLFDFRVERASTQSSGNGLYTTVTIDVDYADGFGRPNTTLMLYRVETNGNQQLVAVGTDSNIAADRGSTADQAGITDLGAGSAGARDGFIGMVDLLAGDYRLVVSNNSQMDAQLQQQLFQPNPTNPLVRIEPLDSVLRISEDRLFNGVRTPPNPTTTAAAPVQVAFSGLDNANEFALADVTLFITGPGQVGSTQSRLSMNNPQLGTTEGVIGNDFTRVTSMAMDPRGRLVGYAANTSPQFNNDGNVGGFILLDDGVTYGTFANIGNTGLETFEAFLDGNGNAVVDKPFGTPGNRDGDGMIINGLAFRIGASTGDNRMYGVGSRGNNDATFDRVIIFPDNSIAVGAAAPSKNVLYRLNPDTGAVIDAGPARTGNQRALGAGTDGVEVGYLQTAAADITGDVTGITFLGNRLYGVTSTGQLFTLANVPDQNPNPNGSAFLLTNPLVNGIQTLTDPDTGNPISFTDLTIGPNDTEGGIYSDILFGIASNGRMYAIGTQGAEYGMLQPIFARGAFSISTGVVGATALDFSNLDENLWSVTNRRGTDAGHGQTVTPTLTRQNPVDGGNSLYFGYSATGSVSREGTWDAGFDPGARSADSYNFAGGAKGSIESYSIDLSEYSLEDEPMLYFNYFLNSEDSSALLNAGTQMRDSLRVYGEGDDGSWRLLATNNLAGYDSNFSRFPGEQQADEFDLLHSGMFDANGDYRFVQQLFNSGAWRQARIPLASFAGSSDVRIRIDFSTAGEPDRNVIEIRGVAGSKINDADEFSVAAPGGPDVVFEFDHGLVLDVPSGAVISEGDTLTVEGTTFTFSTTAGAGVILFDPTDSAATIRARIATALGGLGVGPTVTSPDSGSLLNLPGATMQATATGSIQTAAIIVGQQGVAAGNVPVFTNIAMTPTQVRDAVRTALALGLNVTGQELNESVYPITNESVRIFGGTIVDNGPLVMTGSQATGGAMPGSTAGVYLAAGEQPAGLPALDRLRVAGTRAQNNAFEGVFIDDIVIGFAERGEMVTGFNNNSTPALAANPQFQPIITDLLNPFLAPKQVTETTTGFYQVEVRSSAEYALVAGPRNVPFRTIDTNDVVGEQTILNIVGNGGAVRDGDAFTLSDGVNTVRLEFNNLEIPVGNPGFGVTSGSVAIPFRHSFSDVELTTAILAAINSPPVTSKIDVVAAAPSGNIGLIASQTSTHLVLYGTIAATVTGGTNLGLPAVVTMTRQGLGTIVPPNPFNPPPVYSLTGDRNRVREQGQVIIENNIISDSSQVGILISAGDRDRSGAADIVGPLASTTLPRPGVPINFPTPNPENVLPSVVVANNILVGNISGGLQIVGDTAGGPIPVGFARVINNTIVGRRSGDFGIRVEGNASPTLVNNAIVDQGTGIQVVNNGGQRVEISATLYAGNTANVAGTGGSLGADPITVGGGQPLFLDASRRNFIPAANSQLIDSSTEFTADRLNLGILRSALGIRLSPIIAPERDLTGQLRVNDPSVGSGTGANVFIDRGALDRSDSVGPIARLVTPLDNDVAGRDVDLGETFVRLTEGTLDFFEIQLDDPFGTGPDSLTVMADMVIVTENGRRLLPGIDYTFGFSDTINVVRLTPLSGIWKPGAAYEITLNNRVRQVLSVPTGDQIADGDQVVITDSAGTVARFEFDSGFVATIPAAGVTEGDRVLYTSQSRVRRIEWLLEGSGTTPQPNTNLVLNFNAADTPQTLAEKLADGLRQLDQGLETARAIEGARVYVGGRAGDAITFEGNALAVVGTPGVAANAIAVPIIPSNLLNSDVVAGQLVSAISRARATTLPGLLSQAFTPGGGTVWLERTASVTGLPASGVWTVTTAPAIRDLAGNALQPNRANGETQFTILMPGVQLDLGDAPFDSLIVDNGARHVLGDSALPRLGRLVDAENNASASDDNSPQIAVLTSDPSLADVTLDAANPPLATITIGGIGFDPAVDVFAPADGDSISISVAGRSVVFELTSDAGVGAGNIGIPFDPATVTRESIAQSLNDAINNQTWAIAVSSVDSADPTVLNLSAVDEDGVGVGAVQVANSPIPIDGLFVDPNGNFLGFLNPLDGTAEISITVSGSGLVDAWIDYDQSGDFSGIGEQVLTNSLVLEGDNRFRIPVLSNALDGMTWLRVRLSTTGNQSPDGVAIGGEVEDYQVRVVSVTPPTLVDDAYSVDEDATLTVSAADGVLNGAGADLFAGLSNVQAIVDDSPLFGTLAMNASDGSFTYTPADNFYGTDVFTYRIAAERELVPGDPSFGVLPVLSSDLATVTITVNPLNDVPLAVDSGYITLEDDGTGSDILMITADQLLAGSLPGDFSGFPISPDDPWNESAQTLRISSLTVAGTVLAPAGMGPETLTASTRQGSLVTANFDGGRLVDLMFQATNNYNRLNPIDTDPTASADPAAAPFLPTLDPNDLFDSFQFTVSDDGLTVFPPGMGTIDGNGNFVNQITIGEQSVTHTAFVRVDPVNDDPEFGFVNEHAYDEDSGPITVQTTMDLRPGPINAVDEQGQVVTFTLVPDSANPAGLFATPPQIDSNGVLTFESALHQVGTAIFTVTATDNGPADSAIGDDPQADPVQLTITIRPINDVPEFTGTPVINLLEDEGPYSVQYASGIRPGPIGADDELSQSLAFIVIPDPTNPAGLVVGTPTIDANGVLRFNTASNAVGTAKYTVRLRDNGGVNNPGDVDTSAAQTVTINIRPVNDSPQATSPQIIRNVLEDNSLVIPASEILNGNFVVGPGNEADGTPGGNQTLAIVDFGTKRTANGSVQTIVDGSGVVTAVRYTPDANFNSGPNLLIGDQIFFTVVDNGTTYDLGTMTLDPDPLTVDFQIDLIIEPVNDEPSFSALTSSIRRLEDSGTTTIPGWATNIVAGPPTAGDETNPVTGQNVSFTVTPAPGQTQAGINSLFVPGSITVSPTGTLSFTAVPNAVGTAVVVVTATDTGANDPVRGDDNLSRPVTLTLSLAPVNDAPIANPTTVSYALDEDRSIDIPLTNGVNGLYDIFSVGPANEADGTFGGSQTFATDANLYPRTTVGGGTITPYNNANGQFAGLRYTPAADFNGQDSFVYGVRDNGRTFNLTTGQLFNDPKEAYATVSLSVNPINDRPQFSGGVDVSVSEDAGSNDPTVPASEVGLSRIDNWATNIFAGPATALDEISGAAAQDVTFEVTFVSGTDTAILFDGPQGLPIVDPATGQLIFRTRANANGRAVFQVVAVDNGPEGFPGGDTTRPENLRRSLPRQFAIEVLPANDPPTFTAGGNVVVGEDSGPYNLIWATDISAGPADEIAAGQAVLFDVVVPQADQKKFSAQPMISDTGILRFTPAENAFGQVVVMVTARDTAGGVSMPAIPLTISITAANDRPVAVDDNLTTTEDTVVNISASTLIGNDIDVDLPADTLRISELSETSLQGARVTISADGLTVTYDPTMSQAIQALRPGQTTTDVFTYRVSDLENLASEPATVTVTLTGRNDAPVAVIDNVAVSSTNSTTFNPLANDTDVDGTIAPTTLLVTLQPAFGSLSVNAATGQMTYTPFPSFAGSDLIRYVVRDDLGAISNQADIIIGVNETPVAVNDFVQTFRNEGVSFNPLANDSDPDGMLDPTSLRITSQPSNGLAIVNDDGTIVYEPREGFSGVDLLTYTVSDNAGTTSNIATIEIRVVASRLQNPVNPLDVNNSGQVSPIDALLIINHLNRGGATDIGSLLPGPPFLDVDGDLRVSPVDALRVINSLNRTSGGTGEGEATGFDSAQSLGGPLAQSAGLAAGFGIDAGTEQTSSFDTDGETTKIGCSAWETLADQSTESLDRLIDSVVGPKAPASNNDLDDLWSDFGQQ